MKKIRDFLRAKKNNGDIKSNNNCSNNSEIQIDIQGDICLFKDEKEKIDEGAKQLLESGGAENMEDAIITFAIMFRGLKFVESKIEDGKKVIVLRETAQKVEELN